MILPSVAGAVACLLVLAVTAAVAAGARGRHRLRLARRAPAGPAEKAAFAALDAAARASEPLRGGLTEEGARTAARRIRALLGAEAVAIVGVLPPDGGDGHGDCGREGSRRGACSGGGPAGGAGRVRERPRLLAWDGAGRRAHAGDAVAHALPVLASGRPQVIPPESSGFTDPECTR